MIDYASLASEGLSPRTIIDLLSVRSELRPRALIQVPRTIREQVFAVITRLGLSVEAVRDLVGHHDLTTGEVLLTEPSDSTSTSGLAWSEIWVTSVTPCSDPGQLFADPAPFLGYPTCCSTAYVRAPGVAHLYREYMSERRPGRAEINRLAAFFTPVLPMPDYFPCSLACDAACTHSRPLVEFALKILPETIAKASWSFMSAPLILVGRRLYACPVVHLSGGELRANVSDIVAVTLPKELLPSSADNAPPRMLTFVHFQAVRGIRIVGRSETSPLIPNLIA